MHDVDRKGLEVAQPTDRNGGDVLEILTTVSLADAIYRDLERMIIDGELKGGDHINEKSVAERRGVSRGPVREACRRLEEAGLVEFKVNRGAFVRVVSLEDVLEIYELRAVLFAFAGRILASSISNDQLSELQTVQAKMWVAAEDGDTWAFYDLNRYFHSLTIAYTGNRRLVSVYEGMDKELHLWRKRVLVADSNVMGAAAEHDQIIEVLKNGNATRIAEALRDHSLAGRNRILRAVRAGHLSPVSRTWEQEA